MHPHVAAGPGVHLHPSGDGSSDLRCFPLPYLLLLPWERLLSFPHLLCEWLCLEIPGLGAFPQFWVLERNEEQESDEVLSPPELIH